MSHRYLRSFHLTRTSLLWITVCLGTHSAYVANALPWRPERLPNTPALDEPGMNGTVCNTCHTNGGGTARNPFGLDWQRTYPGFEDFDLTAEQAFAPVADLDSDGDGFTNEEELAVRKHPGNAASTPPPPNTPPTAADAEIGTDEDVAVDVDLVATDPDGDALTYTVVLGPDHGTLSGSAPDLIYTPDAQFSGQDVLTFTASDGQAVSQGAQVLINVAQVDDAPELNAAFFLMDIRVSEGAPNQTLELAGLFSDVDSEISLTASSSDRSVADASIDSTSLRLMFGAAGSATIQVIALGARDRASFAVRVQPSWDVNADGAVDIRDLVTVAAAFGSIVPTGSSADVNGDGVVNIIDLVTVASHFGESALAAPPSQLALKREIDGWLTEARMADDGSDLFRRGIAMLETLAANALPARTRLLPNYPNPFNPETWMPFELAQSGDVSLTIYDASGRTVRRLNTGRLQAGEYRERSRAVYWDGKNDEGEAIASGTYFVVLRAGDASDLRRILLAK